MKVMLKKLSILCCIILITVCCDNRKEILENLKTKIDTKHINFQYEKLDVVLFKAKEQEKKIFIYSTSDGCAPCKKMEKEVFPDSSLINFINSNFICAKSQITIGNKPMKSSLFEKINKTQIAFNDEYKLYGYPTFLVIDAEGNVIQQTTGYKTAKELIQFAKDALSNSKTKN